jgi:hypothetical protein
MKSKKVKEHIITNFLKGIITNADDKVIPNEAISNMYAGKVSTFGINCGFYVEPNKETKYILLNKDEVDGCLVSNVITKPTYLYPKGRSYLVFGKQTARNWYRKVITIVSPYSFDNSILINLVLDLKSLYTVNKLSDDFSELRFTLDADGTQPLPHYIFTHPYPKYGNINRSQYVVHILLPFINQGENYIYMWYNLDDSVSNFNSVKSTFNVDYSNHKLSDVNEDFQGNILSSQYEVVEGIFRNNFYNGYKVWSLGGALTNHTVKIYPPLYTNRFSYYFKFITEKTSVNGYFLFKMFLDGVLKSYIQTSYNGTNINYLVWVNGDVRSTFSIPVQTELNFGSADFSIFFDGVNITINYSTDGGLNWNSIFTFPFGFIYYDLRFELNFIPGDYNEYIHLIHFFGVNDNRIANLSSYSVGDEEFYLNSFANSYGIISKSTRHERFVYNQLKINNNSYMINKNPRCALWDDKIYITSAFAYMNINGIDLYGGLYSICPYDDSINYIDYFLKPNSGFNMIWETGLVDINIYKNFMFVFSPIYIFWSDFSNPLVWDSGMAGNSMLGNLNTDYIVKTLVYKDTLFIFTKWKIYALEWAGYPTLWKITPVVELTKEFYDAVVSPDFIYVLLKSDYFYLYEFNGYSLKLLNYEILNKCVIDDNAEFFIDFEGYVHLITNKNLITYDPYLKLFNINENFITEDYIKNKMHISEYYYPHPTSATESYTYYSVNNRVLMNLYRYKIEKEQIYGKIDFETKKFDFDVPNYSKRLLKVEIVGDWKGKLNIDINGKNFTTENGLITCNLVDKFFKYRISGDKVRAINYIKSYFVVEGTR